jgi:ferredoxin-NADP reductase
MTQTTGPTRTIVREHEAELLVQNAEVVAEDVVALTLVSPTGETLPSWSPGAHIDLMLADDLVRQYSLCSSPAEDGAWRIGGRATTSRWWPHRRTCSSPVASASPRCSR